MANAYFDMLKAVENYYGSGSDQWMTMANWTGYQSTEVAQILKQTPGITTYTNSAGELISYTVDASATSMTAAEATAAAAANTINSNAATAAAVQEAVVVPANVTAGATAGTVEITSGATKVATATKASTVLGHVGTWVVGAGVGMKLGVWIDGALYNANPDFWDSHNMEYLNPERWTETKVTNWLYDYSGYDDFIAFVDDDGQVYIDEQTFALVAQYLNSQNFFNSSNETVELADQSPLFYNNYVMPVTLAPTTFNLLQWGSNLQTFTSENEQGQVYAAIFGTADNDCQPYFFSDAPFELVTYFGQTEYTRQAAQAITRNDETFYAAALYADYTLTPGLVRNPGDPSRPENVGWDCEYMIKHGTMHVAGLEGTHIYDQVPTGITDQMTPEDIIALLKQQLPGLWDDAIKNGSLNDDGTITDRVYIPIAIPDGGPEGQPETSPDHPGAIDPSNPTQVNIGTKILQRTPNPSPTTEDPDVGSGTTPAAPLPTGSADALYKIYNPTNAQIQSFGAWLWSSNFVDQLLKLFSDPMQAIISLHKIYATPHTGGTANIKVGYLDSGVASKWVDQQYIEVDCGTVDLPEIRANVYDYDPFTQVRLYLPFIGIVSLDTADVMRGKIGVKYKVDVITGTVVATVSVARDNGAGGVIYQYTGSCCEAYPLSSGSYMGILTGVLGIAAGVAGTIATGGAAAPALLGGAAGLTAMHTKVEHSNGFSGNAGAMACKKPYLIISRQQTAMSNGIAGEGGYPSNSYIVLNQCRGFTKVKYIHLTGIRGATDGEHDEIIRLLTEGVII